MSFTLGPKQLDILKEVGNIGAGHAAAALSLLMHGRPVQVSVTAARLCDFDDIAEVVGGSEQVVVGVFLRLTGDIRGSVMLLLTYASAENLLHRLLPGSNEGSLTFSELELSALAEVGNILSGSYINAVSELTALRVYQSVPAVAVDMAGAILDVGLAMVGESADSAILINTEMTQGDRVVDGHVFLLPDPQSTGPLLRALGDSDD